MSLTLLVNFSGGFSLNSSLRHGFAKIDFLVLKNDETEQLEC